MAWMMTFYSQPELFYHDSIFWQKWLLWASGHTHCKSLVISESILYLPQFGQNLLLLSLCFKTQTPSSISDVPLYLPFPVSYFLSFFRISFWSHWIWNPFWFSLKKNHLLLEFNFAFWNIMLPFFLFAWLFLLSLWSWSVFVLSDLSMWFAL